MQAVVAIRVLLSQIAILLSLYLCLPLWCVYHVHVVEYNLRYGWHIISPVKSFTVFASTALEKEQWMIHLQQCIDETPCKCQL